MSDKLLIDTSVWLDLANDCRLAAVLKAVEDLIKAGTIELIMSQIVLDEFARSRDRLVENRVGRLGWSEYRDRSDEGRAIDGRTKFT